MIGAYSAHERGTGARGELQDSAAADPAGQPRGTGGDPAGRVTALLGAERGAAGRALQRGRLIRFETRRTPSAGCGGRARWAGQASRTELTVSVGRPRA